MGYRAIAALVGVALAATPSAGQEPSRASFWAELCRETLRDIGSPVRSRPLWDLLDTVSGCGAPGGQILAGQLLGHARSSDPDELERLYVRVARIRDRTVLEAALAVASAPDSSDLARGVAFRILVRYQTPTRWTRFSDFGLPWDTWGSRRRRTPGGTVDHPSVRNGEPLPDGWRSRVADVLRRIIDEHPAPDPAEFGARVALRSFEGHE